MTELSSRYTWEEHAYFLKAHAWEMRFTLNLNYSTIATVWIEDDPEGDKIMQIGEILSTLFGAYLCGPMSNYAYPGRPAHQSFGFWNQELLENAIRIFPLPSGFEPGRPVYLGGIPDWSRLERAYNKRVEDLPRQGS
jgi:hypothetical protein